MMLIVILFDVMYWKMYSLARFLISRGVFSNQYNTSTTICSNVLHQKTIVEFWKWAYFGGSTLIVSTAFYKMFSTTSHSSSQDQAHGMKTLPQKQYYCAIPRYIEFLLFIVLF